MAIQHLKEARLLSDYGKKLGREKISLRVIGICKEVAKEENYKEAIQALGRLKALAIACNYDCYWSEKRDIGYFKELGEATRILNNTKNEK